MTYLIMVNLKTESKMYIFQRKEVLLIEGNSSKFNTNLTKLANTMTHDLEQYSVS